MMSTTRKSTTARTSSLKPSHVLCLLLGVLIMASISTLRGSETPPPQHVYELRMYHAKEGKMDALVARFRDHTEALFQRHNMRSVGYWQPEDPPNSQNLF